MNTRISVVDKRGLVLGANSLNDTKWILHADGIFRNADSISVDCVSDGMAHGTVIRSGDRIVGRSYDLIGQVEHGGKVIYERGKIHITVTASVKK